MYIRKCLAGESAVQQSEELAPEDRARETAAMQLRRVEGINRRKFREQSGFELDILVGAKIARNVDRQLLFDDGEAVYLSREGKFLADSVCSDMFVRDV
jgi:oxygen-independent coproporphyrinogen-3 oxidase